MSEIEDKTSQKRRWSDTEKQNLLKGLKIVGCDNISQLKPYVQTKSINSIRQMVNKYQAIADLGRKEENSPLDVWLRSGIFSDDHTLIPEALLFIHLFEDHPPPEETAGFDLVEAYRLLYEAAKKIPISSISPVTAEMLKQLIVTIDKEIWPASEQSTMNYLISKLSVIESDKIYKRQTY